MGDLIRALATLLWPLIVLLVLVAYRPEVVNLAKRLRRGRGKFLGQEFEVELDALENTAAEAAKQSESATVPASPPPPAPMPEAPGETQRPPYARSRRSSLAEPDDPVERVLGEADVSARLGLVRLSAELERTMRRILASSQPRENWERRSLAQMIDRIQLPQSLRKGVRQFAQVRNRAVHGFDVSDDDVVRALDSGLKILTALLSVDYERHEVEYPSVEVFEDPDGMLPRDIWAVILRTFTATTSRRDVFPTRQAYEPGQLLTWEWDMTHGWPQTWYRDPESGEVLEAWGSAAEFAGRPIDSVT